MIATSATSASRSSRAPSSRGCLATVSSEGVAWGALVSRESSSVAIRMPLSSPSISPASGAASSVPTAARTANALIAEATRPVAVSGDITARPTSAMASTPNTSGAGLSWGKMIRRRHRDTCGRRSLLKDRGATSLPAGLRQALRLGPLPGVGRPKQDEVQLAHGPRKGIRKPYVGKGAARSPRTPRPRSSSPVARARRPRPRWTRAGLPG
jgi:hypothetical protein